MARKLVAGLLLAVAAACVALDLPYGAFSRFWNNHSLITWVVMEGLFVAAGYLVIDAAIAARKVRKWKPAAARPVHEIGMALCHAVAAVTVEDDVETDGYGLAHVDDWDDVRPEVDAALDSLRGAESERRAIVSYAIPKRIQRLDALLATWQGVMLATEDLAEMYGRAAQAAGDMKDAELALAVAAQSDRVDWRDFAQRWESASLAATEYTRLAQRWVPSSILAR